MDDGGYDCSEVQERCLSVHQMSRSLVHQDTEWMCLYIRTTLNKHRHTQTVRLHHTPPTDHHLETISSIIIYIHSIGTRIEITYIRMTCCEPFELHATPPVLPLEAVSCNPLKDQRLHPCLNVLLIHKHYNLGRQKWRKWWQDMQVSEKNLNNGSQ